MRAAPLLLLALTVALVIGQCSATEFAIPNSSAVIGIVGDFQINLTLSETPPVDGIRVFTDTVNETWCVSPEKSPTGTIDIVTVPIVNEETSFWSWLPWL